MAVRRPAPFVAVALTVLIVACGCGNALENREELPGLDDSDDIAGSDDDGNGVRDDVDRYIDNLPDTREQKQSLRQASVAFRRSMIDAEEGRLNEQRVRQLNNRMADAIHCLGIVYGLEGLEKRFHQIRKVTVNTKPRFDARMVLNNRSDGIATTLPNGNTCNGP